MTQPDAPKPEDPRVSVWREVDQAVAGGDADALEAILAEKAEWLGKRPKGADPGCGPELDFSRGARALIAREHGFESWADFEAHRAARTDPGSTTAMFEAAVEAVVSGDVPALERVLAIRGDLIRATSSRAHRATLLHYVGANGVEGFRQRTPPNAVEVAEALLRGGAEVDAVGRMYGGSTTLGLVATSVHPWRAGVQLDLLRVLLAHGAAIDHPQGGGNAQTAVLGCLANGRREASEFLAGQGAALDLEAAAGVGRLDRVREHFDGNGKLRPGATDEQLQSGFHWACQYGRTGVVEFLLERGVDVPRLHRGQTGLHWAAYGGHLEIVRRLLGHGAPVDALDERWGRTPLGWAVYGWLQPPDGAPLRHYPEVVAELVGRGAVVRPDWLQDPRVSTDARMSGALRGEAVSERTRPPDLEQR